MRGLCASPALEALAFERCNKPQWSVRIRVRGDPAWLEGEVASLLADRLGPSLPLPDAGPHAGPDAGEETWLGGKRDGAHLRRIDHVDTVACLDLMEAEWRGLLSRPRPEFSLKLVERFLDLVGLDHDGRLEFDRLAYQWALDLGRWDTGVLEALDGEYPERRQAFLAALVESGPHDTPEGVWGGIEAARIAQGWLDGARAALGSAGASQPVSVQDRLDLARLVVRAHTNRLGIHAPHEAVLRYYVRCARQDRAARQP